MATELLIAIISLLGGVLVFEPILFYRQYKKIKSAQVTDANIDNSNLLIDILNKYIDLIEDKDKKIRELTEELISCKERIVFLNVTRCENVKCTLREPPLGYIKNNTITGEEK